MTISQRGDESRPTASSQRHHFVDALRGFALLGILLVNIEFIVQPAEVGWSNYDSGIDKVVRWFVIAFGQTKVYPIFALLFGYGLSLQRSRDTSAGDELRPRYRRRMVGLVLLGVLHGIGFFPGDILVIYSCVGAICFRFASWDNAALLKLAQRVYFGAAIFWLLVAWLDVAGGGSIASVSDESLAPLVSGSFLDVVVHNIPYWIVTFTILCAIQGPAVFAFFFAGMVLGRTTVLADPMTHRDVAFRSLRWAPLGLVGAAIGATLTVIGGRWETLGFAVGFAAAPFVAASYIAGLSLVIGEPKGGVAGAVSYVLRASGRMSLTVYLLESVVAAVISYGYGFGLFLSVSPVVGEGLALGIWLALSVFAVVWMKWARFGPMEWVLRSFTYGAAQPMWRVSL